MADAVTELPDRNSPRNSTDPADGPPPIRHGLVFAIIAVALMMMSINSTIVATALHALQHSLNAPINWTGWTITAYSLGFVLALPITGMLSEQYGRRRVFTGSIVVFTIASLLCGLAEDIYTLIALRTLQAMGGAGFTPSATGLVVDHFGERRDRMVGLFGSIFPVGAMIGPIFGGLFVTYWSWRGIFWINVPIGVVILGLTLRFIPKDRPGTGKRRSRTDAVGMLLLGGGLLSGMLAISYLGERGARPWAPDFLAPLAIAVLALWAFLRHIRNSSHPFIAPELITGPSFGRVNLITILYGGIPSGMVALIPLYATNRYGIDALGSGTLLVAQAAAAFVFSIAAVFALRRTGYRLPLLAGGIIVAFGMAALASTPLPGLAPYTWLAGAAFIVGTGSGTLNPANRNAGLQLAPEHASTLAALRSMCIAIGSIVAIAIATAILAGVEDAGGAQAWIYAAVALLLLGGLPLIARVPEHRGAW